MKRKYLAPLIVAAVIAGLLAWYQRPAARLRRQVDYWAYGSEWRNADTTMVESDTQQANGLRALGPGAIDFLRQDVQLKDTFWEQFRFRLFFSAPAGMRRMLAPGGGTRSARRMAAASVLALLGPEEAKAAVPELLAETIRGSHPASILALAVAGDSRPQIIATLAILTNHPSMGTSMLAAYALWRLQGQDSGAVALCNRRLGDPASMDTFAVSSLARELSRLGPAARPFVPGLEAAMNSHFRNFLALEIIQKMHVARALWQITGSSQAALNLLAMCQDPALMAGLPTGITAESEYATVAYQFSDVPEICRVSKPVLEAMKLDANLPLKAYRTATLARSQRTLGASTNAPVRAAP